MSQKISELGELDPPLLSYFTFVFGADNWKCPLPAILYSEIGEEKKFGANGGSLTFDAQGFAILDVPDGQGIIVRVNGQEVFNLDGNEIIATTRNGGLFKVKTDNPAIVLSVSDSSPHVQLLADDENAEVTYIPNDDGNWDGAITAVHQALDELAARVRALE